MFVKVKFIEFYLILFVSIFFLKDCSCFHLHIVPNNNQNQVKKNNLLENNENIQNIDLNPFEKITNIILSKNFIVY